MKQLLLTVGLVFLCAALHAQDLVDPNVIIKKYKTANAIQNLNSSLSYKNISKKGRVQERKLEQYILKNNHGTDTYNFLLKFVSPNDVRNTATLTIQHEGKEDNQWLYLPVIRSAKKISASKKSDRFMGTEMSYEDLSNYLTEPDDEYKYELVGIEQVGQNQTYKIVATPRPGAKSQYSRRELWISTDHFILLRSDFYDEANNLLKRYNADDVRLVSGTNKYRAHFVSLVNVQTKNSTEVRYSDFVIDQGVDKGIFTKSYIETL